MKNLQSYPLYKKEKVKENRELNHDELFWIKYILGHGYTKANYVKHSLYDHNGTPSVLFSKPSMKYSEAFAGSGELAVVRTVVELLKAAENSLVLLDEPETSLHPCAQVNLLYLLLHLIKTKYIQVVLSTHSPVIVETLPNSAVKILEESPSSKNTILKCSHPQMAFKRLGYKQTHDKIVLAVEDQLLAEVLQAAIRRLDPGERDMFDIYIPPGGADTILSHHISAWIPENRRIFIFLDGDKKPKPEFNTENYDLLDLPALKGKIKQMLNCIPFLPELDEISFLRKYINFIRSNVFYLDSVCPEHVWLQLVNKSRKDLSCLTNQQSKQEIVDYYAKQGVSTSASDLSCYFRAKLLEVAEENSSVNHFCCILREIIKNRTK